MYDPKTKKYTAYQTCFGSHHLQFGYDANETIWASTGGGGGNVGWINTKMLDETGDIEKSQGWTALVMDTNGNGQRDEYTEPGKPQEPGKDMRIGPTFYAVMPSPTDGSIWGSIRGNPGSIVRIDPTKNPHKSLAEQYNVPLPGFGPRGGDIDKQGRVWLSLASGHMGYSTAACAKARLTAPRQLATTAQKAGHSTSIRAQASRALARTVPRRATTRGSISTTPSAWAMTFRCQLPI